MSFCLVLAMVAWHCDLVNRESNYHVGQPFSVKTNQSQFFPNQDAAAGVSNMAPPHPG